MEIVYRVAFCTLIFCHYTRSMEEECNNPLGMENKSIPDESLTSSSKLDSNHEAFHGRIEGNKAWCSAIEDKNPYIEITLDEEKTITEIVTQGSASDLIWSTKYRIEYLEGGKWTSYKEEHSGNKNCCRRKGNSLHPAIRTRSIRIYPKQPFGLMSPEHSTPACLRLELYGCSAPAGCSDPGRPVNGAREGDSFNHGSRITFSCMQDFVLVGDSTSVCHRGKWSHDLPKCKATCNDPGIPENGNRNRNGNFIDGDSVEFNCNRNYSLSGPPTIRCLAGRWSSALPQCKASCPDPGIPQNGERVGTNFRHENDVQFTCKPGFWLFGSRQIVCNEGKWNYDTPKCKAVCSDPGIPVNGIRIGSDFRDGQMVAYMCKPNFSLVGASAVFCVAGQWNATRPACKASCSDPGKPKHGRRIGSNFGHGHQVTFMCLPKYSLMGSQSMTCHDGKWSSVHPVCKAYCKEPAPPQNGVRHGNEFEHNKRISFACHPGFQLIGAASAVCIDGNWSHPVDVTRCKAVCPDPGTPVNGSRIGNNFLAGQTVAFTCQQNYKLVGPQVLRCVAGKWNRNAPRCKAPCPDTSVPSNGQVLDSRPVNRHGARVRFACDSGFKMEGPSSITCNDGKWNSNSPMCKDVDECATGISDCHPTAICNNTLGSYTCTCKGDSVGNGRTCLKLCKDPGAPTNGARRGHKFQHGKRVSFSCNAGYTLVGNRSITCLEGEWNSAPPHCKENCADPGVPSNGLRGGNDFQHGKQVLFDCRSDFKLSGVNSITCNDGIWSDTIPVCTALCKDPGILQHGARKGDNFEDGKTVNFTCNDGYTLVGSRTIECRKGIWNSALPQCKENCADPGAPPNGLRRGNDFQHGKQVTFDCQPDFKLIGINSITCNDGTWSDTVPVCTALCKDPGIPQHGARKGDNFEDGKTVNFTCNNGYTLVGSSTIECRSGIWSSALFQCKENCVDPGAPPNGFRRGNDFQHGKRLTFDCQPDFKLSGVNSITCNDGIWSDTIPVCTALCKDPGILQHGARKGDNFEDGKTVNFTCNDGYTLVGSRTIECRKGIWNSALPQCKENCADPGALPNGLRRGNDFQHGKQVTFDCQPDFKLIGINSITCNDGTWSDTVPVCTALCKDPGIPQHGARKGDNFEDGKTVNFTCNNGYTLVGSSTIECRSGIWSSALFQCKENCVDPGAPPNGFRRGNDFQHGKRLTFDCQPDFKLSGVNSITCNDGRWSDTIPLCTALCKDPGIPQHGARKGDIFEDGKTANFTCNNGYTLVGSSTIECRKGIWNSALPQCKRPCANPGTPRNGLKIGSDFRHGRKVTFVCQAGFKLTGISSITCQDGRWSDPVPVCKVLCKIPTQMNNGVILRGNYDNEGTIEFSCNHGYKLMGSRVLRCVSGRWNDRIPECRKATCPNPPRLVHGSHDGNDFSVGKKVTYSCNAAYLLEGNTVITCVDGKWVGQVPVCRAPCSPPRAPTNGFVFGLRNRLHHSRVQYGCDEGYVLRGSSSSQCNDGDWDSPTPVCEVTCPNPDNITDGSYRGIDYTDGGTVTYVCDNQYFLDGSSNITCVDGRWNSPPPVCRAPCPAPVPPANGFVFGESHQHNSIIQFFCKGGFTLRGSSFSECVDGKWNTPKPTCEALCRDPGIPQNGARKGDNFEDGKTVTFTCNNGYTLVGSSIIKCRKGIWSSALPQCKRPSPSSCRKPAIPLNALMLDAQAQKVWFNDAERIYYKCNLGFSPSGFSIRRCNKGVWTTLHFRCTVKSCGHPGTPVNGRLNSYMFTYNSSVKYSCNQGYTLVGSEKRVCQANQTWSGTLPQCTTVNCGTLPTPANAEKVLETSTFLNGQVTFRCIGRQFKLVGSSTRTCLASKQWSGQQPSCELINCGDPGIPMHSTRNVRVGFFYRGSVEFNCNANYKLVGVSRIFCKIDGNWSRALPRCLAPCSNPGTPRYGRRTGNDFRHGETVRFNCKRNYRLVGLKELTCDNGQWGGVKPKCRPRKG